MPTLIHSDQTWLLWAVILGGVAVSIWLEQRYNWAAKLSGPVIALCVAMCLANLRVMPPEAPAYETIHTELVPLALPLLLFRANIIHIARSTGWLLFAFHLASAGTVAGAIGVSLAMHERIPETPQLAGIMTASYIGGAINFFAVASSYDITGTTLGALLVADNFIMAGMFIVLLLMCRSNWLLARFPHPHTADAVDSRKLAAEHWRRKEISLFDIAAALAIAVAVVAFARFTAELAKSALVEAGAKAALAEVLGNRYVHITVWSTLLATLVPGLLAKINGSEEFGAYLLYVFLFVIGLPADLWTVITGVPLLFVFCLVIALANLATAVILGKLFRLNIEHVALAVNASLGGQRVAGRATHSGSDGHLDGLVQARAAGTPDRSLGLHDRHGGRPRRGRTPYRHARHLQIRNAASARKEGLGIAFPRPSFGSS